MIKGIGQLSVVCLLLGAAEVQAVPVTFEFSATASSVSTGNGGVPAPAPFNDFTSVVGAAIFGTFTIETDTLGAPAPIFRDSVWIEDALTFYSNPLTQLAFNIGDQQFNFNPGVGQSSISVLDIPGPGSNPATNYDSYDIDVSLGSGVFPGAYNQLSASLGMVRTERDLSVITSQDMLANLVPSENWSLFFTIYDTATPFQDYQIFARVTNLAPVVSVLEPGTAALLGLGLVLSLSGFGRRAHSRTAATTEARLSG